MKTNVLHIFDGHIAFFLFVVRKSPSPFIGHVNVLFNFVVISIGAKEMRPAVANFTSNGKHVPYTSATETLPDFCVWSTEFIFLLFSAAGTQQCHTHIKDMRDIAPNNNNNVCNCARVISDSQRVVSPFVVQRCPADARVSPIIFAFVRPPRPNVKFQ